MIRAVSALLVLLSACSPAPPSEPAATPAATTPADLKALETMHDWQTESGDKLNADWDAGVKNLLGKMSRSGIISAVESAGFACTYGEAHPDYPDPMAVCTRSFATRACQMDWEISSTAENGMVDEVDGMFTRDCVGVDRDWPEPKASAIDDQLAPAPPLP